MENAQNSSHRWSGSRFFVRFSTFVFAENSFYFSTVRKIQSWNRPLVQVMCGYILGIVPNAFKQKGCQKYDYLQDHRRENSWSFKEGSNISLSLFSLFICTRRSLLQKRFIKLEYDRKDFKETCCFRDQFYTNICVHTKFNRIERSMIFEGNKFSVISSKKNYSAVYTEICLYCSKKNSLLVSN